MYIHINISVEAPGGGAAPHFVLPPLEKKEGAPPPGTSIYTCIYTYIYVCIHIYMYIHIDIYIEAPEGWVAPHFVLPPFENEGGAPPPPPPRKIN